MILFKGRKKINNPRITLKTILKFWKDFKQKSEIFGSHFSKQCTSLINNSKIPSECPGKSNESLTSIAFEMNDVEKIIKNLVDPNKSHGYDMLSFCMLKLCGLSV